MGVTNAHLLTKWGAFVSSKAFSYKASFTKGTFNCAKYLTPPCISLVDLEEVPFA
ncbi:hypothetical protein BOFE_06180 [Candidatus Borrelia fainii]|uniref:Uncharacterized protein n=1 Tax=Candidatus Borrelia fainii TaxID=2518322 RepID=A0ABM8DKG6_9SPIR|nr:hypothetical protein BOFE_06180 [Candidatus Borrelia fainii]